MSNGLFILTSALCFGVLLVWGFRTLPREKWQFLAAIPGKRHADGSWQAVNLTYYGLFNALAHMAALSFLFILTGAVGVGQGTVFFIMLAVLGICLPASRFMASWVEKKANTFTVGGASFVGILLGPVALWLVYRLLHHQAAIPWFPLLGAMALAYAVGEGIGRLACISFGCCYGKPLAFGHHFLNRIYQRCAFVFTGELKKAVYEGNLGGRKIFPIQAVTATLFIGVALIGMYLFLSGFYELAFFLTITVTQVWRLLSEMLRADNRGGGSFSAYQIMAILALLYTLIIWLILPSTPVVADIQAGMRSFWHPGTILAIQLWGAFIFWYTGSSRVTGACISYHLHKERI